MVPPGGELPVAALDDGTVRAPSSSSCAAPRSGVVDGPGTVVGVEVAVVQVVRVGASYVFPAASRCSGPQYRAIPAAMRARVFGFSRSPIRSPGIDQSIARRRAAIPARRSVAAWQQYTYACRYRPTSRRA
jgi:hypothetical protein